MLNKVADVLEKVAAYLDAQEAQLRDEENEQRTKLAEVLRDKYETVTGETLDDSVIEKISSADVDILAAFERLSAKTADDMGSPVDMPGERTPKTASEFAQDADAKFINWVLSK